MNLIKRCKVCGDQATGFNYQGLNSCQSCKLFFHRYGFETKKFKCKWADQCEINIETRKKCRKCRLEKCFKIGMNRNTKQNSKTTETIDLSITTSQNNEIENLLIENLFTQIPTFLISPFAGLNSIGRNLKQPINLSDYENTKIDEVLSAINVVIDETKLPVGKHSNCYYDSFWCAEVYIKMFIKFCKQMSSFNLLSEQDQFLIFKPFCFDILMIRFAFVMNFDKGGWPVIMDANATETLFVPFNLASFSKIVKNHHDRFIVNYDYAKMLQNEMENDPIIRDLLTILLLFKHQDKISCFEFIRYNYTLYSRLLQRYLEHKYKSVSKANKKLLSLTKLAVKFPEIRENERILFGEMDFRVIPHIIVELYDLV